MENENIITYKWEQGIYNLKDLIYLVEFRQITPAQFFEITRYNYAATIQKYKDQIRRINNGK